MGKDVCRCLYRQSSTRNSSTKHAHLYDGVKPVNVQVSCIKFIQYPVLPAEPCRIAHSQPFLKHLPWHGSCSVLHFIIWFAIKSERGIRKQVSRKMKGDDIESRFVFNLDIMGWYINCRLNFSQSNRYFLPCWVGDILSNNL